MSSPAGEPILRCADLWKSFGPEGRRVEVLRGLDLEVRRGEMVAVLGESGTGKTTLLHLIGGIDRPDRGSILFRGRDVAAAGAHERAVYRNRDLGFVFQFHHLRPCSWPTSRRAIWTRETPRPSSRSSSTCTAGAA